MCSTFRLEVTLLTQGELLTETEDFCREGRAGVQTEEQKTPYITHQRKQQART